MCVIIYSLLYRSIFDESKKMPIRLIYILQELVINTHLKYPKICKRLQMVCIISLESNTEWTTVQTYSSSRHIESNWHFENNSSSCHNNIFIKLIKCSKHGLCKPLTLIKS